MGFWDDIFKGQPTGAADSFNAGDAAAFFNANDAEKVRRIPGTSDADIANGGAGSQFERNYAGTDGTSQGLNALGSPAAAAKKKSAGVETSAVSAKYEDPKNQYAQIPINTGGGRWAALWGNRTA
mgnify:CR=1 FL=1|tara:strand:+ start:1561 stop:1935 length:375 start_codon:yes stop_codon:yes gene_type:complete